MTRSAERLVQHARALQGWFSQPHRVYGLWFGKHSVAVAWLGLLLAIVFPPQGPGVAFCSFHAATGWPCPGCGMLRSLSCGVRGLFFESWHFHPMGLLILGLFVVIAGQSLCPKSFRDSVARRMQISAFLVGGLYVCFVAVFVSFGIVRALACVAASM